MSKVGKVLTVKDLKDAFGTECETVNRLTEGKPDDYAFGSLVTVDTNDYFISVLWGKEDIAAVAEHTGIDLTPETADDIFNALKKSNINDVINTDDNLVKTAYAAILRAVKTRASGKCS